LIIPPVEAERRSRPSGLKQTARIASSWPLKVRISRAEAGSQIVAASPLPPAASRPSGP
jgi:hypothetical protein